MLVHERSIRGLGWTPVTAQETFRYEEPASAGPAGRIRILEGGAGKNQDDFDDITM